MDADLQKQMDQLHTDLRQLSKDVVDLKVEITNMRALRNELDMMQRIVHGDSSSPGMKAEIAYVRQEREQQNKDRRLQWTFIIVLGSTIAAEWIGRFV